MVMRNHRFVNWRQSDVTWQNHVIIYVIMQNVRKTPFLGNSVFFRVDFYIVLCILWDVLWDVETKCWDNETAPRDVEALQILASYHTLDFSCLIFAPETRETHMKVVVCIKNREPAWRGWDMPDNIFDNSGWDTWNYVQWDISNWLEGDHVAGVTET